MGILELWLQCGVAHEVQWGAQGASLSITNSWSLPRLMSIELVMPSNHFLHCYPLLLLPSIFPSIKVFSNELAVCIRWPKHWSFNFSISPSDEYSGLMSLRMDWLDHLEVQGTLKRLLQHHSSKASILQCSAFFRVQLTSIHDYWKSHSFDYLQWRRSQFDSRVGKICWRRDRLPTSVFLGFPCGLAGKESACNTGDLGLIPGLGRSPEERLPTPVFWPGEFHGLGSQRVGHNWMTFTFTFIQVHARL